MLIYVVSIIWQSVVPISEAICGSSTVSFPQLLFKCSVAKSYLTLCDPMNCPWNFPGKNTGMGCHFPTPVDLSDPGIEPTPPVSPVLQEDSLPAEPSGKHGAFHPVFNLELLILLKIL